MMQRGFEPGKGLATGIGRFKRKTFGWASPSGTTTITVDASLNPIFGYAFTAGGAITFAFSNPESDTDLTLILTVGATALTSLTWPGSVVWNGPGGAPPSLQVNTTTVINLHYDAAFATWFEVSQHANSASDSNPNVIPTGNWWPLVTELTTTLALSGFNGLELCYPFFVSQAQSIKGLQCEITVAGSAGAALRMGIRADGGNGQPGPTVIVDAGTVAATGTGMKSVSFAATPLKSGWYWASCTLQGNPATGPTVRAYQIGDNRYPIYQNAPTAGGLETGFYQSGVTGALPSTWTGAGILGAGSTVKMYAQAN